MDTAGSGHQRVSGPLASFETAFEERLTRAGYASRSVYDLVRAMARLSVWLQERSLAPSGLTPGVVAGVGIDHVGPVVRFLRGIGEVPTDVDVDDVAPVETLLGEFRGWLAAERGLAAESVRCYVTQARKFLVDLPEPLDVALDGLGAGHVTSFMLVYCRDRNTWSAKAAVTAIRALLRFLHVAGYTPVSLTGAVPAVAGWRLASLPRRLPIGDVQLLLEGCDRDSVVGRRDYAILLVLARLGLRGAEVAALELGDIDWRGGEVIVRGKGNRIEQLPVPVDVGEALAAYVMTGRPRCDAAAVFCTVRAPYRRLTPAAVRAVMGNACKRAGLDRVGAHRLRHTLASEMLRAGASLPEVGQVLRHRSQLATTIYAKVDENALRVLVRPWPRGGVS